MGLRLMVVEDDDDFLRALRWRLRNNEVEVHQVTSPHEAIRLLRLEQPPDYDFILSDLMFRGCATGEDVIRAARARGIPSLLCSDLLEFFAPEGCIRKFKLLERPWTFIQALLPTSALT